MDRPWGSGVVSDGDGGEAVGIVSTGRALMM